MIIRNSIIYSAGIAVSIMLSACSSHIPPEIKQPLEGSPDVTQVQQKVDAYQSQKVRWGGIILQTDNKQDASELTIVALPLSDNGEPQGSDKSQGRFIAVINEFIEPLVYSPDRKITITGHILRTETRNIGEFAYEYPVVEVEHYYLWPAEPEQTYIDYPPYLWYDPYYPWHHPYYYPYYY